jgi:hypothetical protein
VKNVNFQKYLSNRTQDTQKKLHSSSSKLSLIIDRSQLNEHWFRKYVKWQIWIFSKSLQLKVKHSQKLHFLHLGVLSYISIATIFASTVEGVARVKIANFEEYPFTATRGTARRFITVTVNCTWYVADCNHNYTVYSECTCNGGWIFVNNRTKAAKIQPSSYTAVQITEFNFDSLQTTTQRFQKIHVQRQMWIIWKIPPTKAETPPRMCLFFRWSVFYYWSIAAKCTSAVVNESAVRDVKFQEISLDGKRDKLDKGIWLMIDRQISNRCAVPHMYLNLELQNNKSYTIYTARYTLNWHF